MVAGNEPVSDLEHATYVHRIQKLVGRDLAVAQFERCYEAVGAAGLERGQRDRLFAAVDLAMLGRELACAVFPSRVPPSGR